MACRVAGGGAAKRARRPGAARGARARARVRAVEGARFEDEHAFTFDNVVAAGEARGLLIAQRRLGPFFSITARFADAPDPTSEEALAGEATGYVLGAPLRVLRFDQLRVYNSRLRGRTGGARSIFGVGGLLGAAALPLAAEADCTKGELLAINDVEWYRDRLVKYYGRLGFEAVKEVEGGMDDLADMLIFGGAGTKMEASMATLMRVGHGIVTRQKSATGGGGAADK